MDLEGWHLLSAVLSCCRCVKCCMMLLDKLGIRRRIWWQCQSTLHGYSSICSRSEEFHSNAELHSRAAAAAEWQLWCFCEKWKVDRESSSAGSCKVDESRNWSLGWQKYLGELVAWAMQASLELGNEIEHSSRWPGPLTWSEMTMQQRSRSMRLFAIIKSTFANHARTATLINAFSEGISLASSSVDMNSWCADKQRVWIDPTIDNYSIPSEHETKRWHLELHLRTRHLYFQRQRRALRA